MKRDLSVYLDLFRLCAALTVLCAHLTFAQMTGGILPYQHQIAGFGVTAFFVLSGFVIAFVSDTKEKTLTRFAVSRLARVYSVALPALGLTMVIDLLTMHFGWKRHMPVYQYHNVLLYLTMALTFMGHALIFHEPAFGNAMYWSLDYEVWYYIIFAAMTFYSGRKRAVLVPLLIVFAGPRILILMPMWLLGVFIYRATKIATVGQGAALTGFLLSFALLIAVRLSGLDDVIDGLVNTVLGGWPVRFLSNSQNFASNYVVALLFGLNIFSAAFLSMPVLRRTLVKRTIVYTASFTFVLYLTHFPLLFFYANVLHHDPHSFGSVLGIVVATLVTVWLLGFITEHKKKAWRKFFQRVLERSRGLIAGYLPAIDKMVSTDR